MGITISTVNARAEMKRADGWPGRAKARQRAESSSRMRSGPNTLAWFLDNLAQRLEPTLPARIFSQAIAPPAGPGDLDPSACALLAGSLERASEQDVLAAYAPLDGEDPEPGIKLAREIAALVRRAGEDGGLSVF